MPADFRSAASAARTSFRRHPIVGTALGALVVLFVIAAVALQGAFLRAPLERFLSEKSGHAVTIGKLDLGIQHGFTLRAHDLAAAPLTSGETVPLQARLIELRVAPLALLRGDLVLRRLVVQDANLYLERDAAGKWNLAPLARFAPTELATKKSARKKAAQETPQPPPRQPITLPFVVERLSLADVTVQFRDEILETQADLKVATIAPKNDTPYRTRVEFTGTVEDDRFAGEMLAGEVLSLQDTAEPLPIDLQLKAAQTELHLQGEVADMLAEPHIDARVRIAGPSLRNLYPTLPLALPSTPPYRLTGQLSARRGEYRMTEIDGRIGRTDVAGEASFDARQRLPKLDAKLRSKRLAIADLGVLIGTGEKRHTDRLLPDSRFDRVRLNAMDADVELTAQQMIMPDALALEDFASKLHLRSGKLQLDPLRFGYAGGNIVSNIVLDGRQNPIRTDMSLDFRNIDFNKMFQALDRARLSSGKLGAQIRLIGFGPSVAEFLGSSSGTLAMAMSGGRISHTVLAAASLDGGKLIPLLIKGDEPVDIRCAALSMSIEKGTARSQLLVFDTEKVRIDGDGALDLKSEQIDFEFKAKPKAPSMLSLRAPVYVQGTLGQPKVGVTAGALLRGGAALALTAVNPLAALLPLVETGGGEDTDCRRALKPVVGALDQASESPARTPPVKNSDKNSNQRSN